MTRRDVYLYTIELHDPDGNPYTIRVSRGTIDSTLFDDISDLPWPVVVEGGLEYESPNFDPHHPQYGVESSVAPQSLVCLNFIEDRYLFDQFRAYRWAGATVTIQHGGYTD